MSLINCMYDIVVQGLPDVSRIWIYGSLYMLVPSLNCPASPFLPRKLLLILQDPKATPSMNPSLSPKAETRTTPFVLPHCLPIFQLS